MTDNSSNLIDNFFCNIHNVQLTSGIIVCDISDHLPIYIIRQSFHPGFSVRGNEFSFKRDTSSSSLSKCSDKLCSVDWNVIYNNSDVF